MLNGSTVAAAAAVLALAGCGGGDDIRAFCDKVKELEARGDPLADAGADIDAVKAGLEETRGLAGELAEVAPAEIQADAEETQEFFTAFAEQVEGVNSAEDLLAVGTEFEERAEEFAATSERLADYSAENCAETGSEDEPGSGS